MKGYVKAEVLGPCRSTPVAESDCSEGKVIGKVALCLTKHHAIKTMLCLIQTRICLKLWDVKVLRFQAIL